MEFFSGFSIYPCNYQDINIFFQEKIHKREATRGQRSKNIVAGIFKVKQGQWQTRGKVMLQVRVRVNLESAYTSAGIKCVL
jgi:hypothetical protein